MGNYHKYKNYMFSWSLKIFRAVSFETPMEWQCQGAIVDLMDLWIIYVDMDMWHGYYNL